MAGETTIEGIIDWIIDFFDDEGIDRSEFQSYKEANKEVPLRSLRKCAVKQFAIFEGHFDRESLWACDMPMHSSVLEGQVHLPQSFPDVPVAQSQRSDRPSLARQWPKDPIHIAQPLGHGLFHG